MSVKSNGSIEVTLRGAQGSGKTRLLDALARAGWRVSPEAQRRVGGELVVVATVSPPAGTVPRQTVTQ